MANEFSSNLYKYMKNYKTFCNGSKTDFDWNHKNKPIKIGESIKISNASEDYAGLEGVVMASIKKNNPNSLKIKFENGKTAYIDKKYLIRF